MKAKKNMLDWLGVLQHHDAITGTEKQIVADDYAVEAHSLMSHSNEVYSRILA